MNANTPNANENVRRQRGGPGRNAPEPTSHGGGRGTLLVALLGTHVPLLVLVAYLALSFPGGLAVALPLLGAALAGTLAAGAVVFRELRTLLASVSRASRALRDYRERGEIPALPAGVVGGEGGRLLHDVQETLCRLEGVIGSLEQLSAKDPLTGAYNRRACEERLAEDTARASRGEGRLAGVLVDGTWLDARGRRRLPQAPLRRARAQPPRGRLDREVGRRRVRGGLLGRQRAGQPQGGAAARRRVPPEEPGAAAAGRGGGRGLQRGGVQPRGGRGRRERAVLQGGRRVDRREEGRPRQGRGLREHGPRRGRRGRRGAKQGRQAQDPAANARDPRQKRG